MRRWQWGALLALGAGGAIALYYRDRIRWRFTGVKLREVVTDPTTGEQTLPPAEEGAAGIIPDVALFPYQPLPYARLASRLEDLGSYLYTLVSPVGEPILALIDRVSREENVNPAFAFTRIQNEQSGWTITESDAAELRNTPKTWLENGVTFTGTALDYKLRWLLGYGRMDASTISRFGGWDNQIVAAIRRARYLVDNPIYPRLVPVDGKQFDPATRADRFFLTYTPHAAAIFETRKVYETWFPELLA